MLAPLVRLSLTATLLLAQACGPAPAPAAAAARSAVDTAAVVAQLTQVWKRLGDGEANGDVSAFTGVFTETARIDGQYGTPLIGRTAIEGKARQSFAARKYHSMDMVPAGTRIWDSAAAHQYGSLVEVHTPHGEKTRTEHGRWAAELVKGSDGQWRINHLIAFLDSSGTFKK
jgi:uncharacterized protein (TIGR02246 family)